MPKIEEFKKLFTNLLDKNNIQETNHNLLDWINKNKSELTEKNVKDIIEIIKYITTTLVHLILMLTYLRIRHQITAKQKAITTRIK